MISIYIEIVNNISISYLKLPNSLDWVDWLDIKSDEQDIGTYGVMEYVDIPCCE